MFDFQSFLFKDNSVWFHFCVALLVVYLIYYIKNIISYPRGPFPLPVLGNLLHFRGKFTDPSPLIKMSEWAKKYGPIYTLWAGNTPILVINSFELNTEASVNKKNDFIFRPDNTLYEIFRNNSQNVFSSNGPHWEALRKVAIFAIRKFVVSDRLPVIINEVVDEAIDLMVKQKQMNPILYIDFIIYNILSMTAYGQKMGSMDSTLFKDAKRVNDEFYEVAGNGLVSDYAPWLKPFYYKRELALRDMNKVSTEITKNLFYEHKKTFTPGVIRDFSDCVLEAKEEAIRENFERKNYLNDNNLFMVVSDLFQAGTDTSQTTLRWAFLMLGNYPEIQEKMFTEIKDNIGDRFPTQDDKNILPLTYAFVLEVLRFRPPAPVGLDHCAAVDSELAGYNIPKGTIIVFNLYEQNNDPKYWENPEKFNPYRFLDSNGKLKTGRFPSFMTFGLGRRGCPGDKLALANNFLAITRLIQRTRIELVTGRGTANVLPLNILIGCFPRDYEIICTLR